MQESLFIKVLGIHGRGFVGQSAVAGRILAGVWTIGSAMPFVSISRNGKLYGMCFISCVWLELEDLGMYLKVQRDSCNLCFVCAYAKV